MTAVAPQITTQSLDANLSSNELESMLANLEAGISTYPEDLRLVYEQSVGDLSWARNSFGDQASDIEGMSARDLAMSHCLMFASAFAVSASSLPGRELIEVSVTSTEILEVVTNAGFPAREFLSQYGKYGNQFTWKLLNLTGRISGSGNQTAPDLVKGV